MATSDKDERWLFGKASIYNAPSTQDPDPVDHKLELHYRQLTANFIQEMGQKLQVTQLCINTAIVYMHRFYMFQRFQRFNKNHIGAGCLYLAAKIEEQPRKLEHVTKVAYMLQHRDGTLDTKGETYLMLSTELIKNENILLPTLGFDLMVDHPHTHVVKTCQMIKASKDLAQTSYFLATNSLHLTTMCLKYRPTVVACVCIHLASKWGNWELQSSAEGKPWYSYVDKFVTPELLEELTIEFLEVLDGCPAKLKKRIMTWRSGRDRDEDKDKECPPEKKTKVPSNSTPATANPTVAAKADPSKERADVSMSESDKKVRFKLENSAKVVPQSDKTNLTPDAAVAAANVPDSGSLLSSSSLSYPCQKIDLRKKIHKGSSVTRMESTPNVKVVSTTKASDRHSHMVHHHQNAPLKLTIKAPTAPSDADAKISGTGQMSGKWSHQSSNRLKLDNHSGSTNLTVKQGHNIKEYAAPDRIKESNHMPNLKSHSDYLLKQGSSRMPSIDHSIQGQSTSSKSALYQNNTYSAMPSATNDVQYDSTYKIKRPRACPPVHPYKVAPKHPQSSSQSLRYNSYHQQPSSELRMDNDKILTSNFDSNGSGLSQTITNSLSTGMSSASVTATAASGGREQFDELQLQLQQLIDIQKKNIREQRQKYAMDFHK